MPKTIYSSGQERLTALLKEARVEAGLTQVEVARRLKVPQSFISKYESGERRLDLIELQLVCEALDIRLGAFVRRFEQSLSR